MFKIAIVALMFMAVTARAYGEDKAPPDTSPAMVSPIEKGQRVFSCGHSFHGYVPTMLAEMAQAAGFKEHKVVGTSIIGGSKVIQHWNIPDESNKAKQALRAKGVDVLTLTPIYLPDEGIEKFAEFGLENNLNLRITVQEFWLPFDENQPHYYDPPKIPAPKVVNHNAATIEKLQKEHAEYFREMDQHIRILNRKLGMPVLLVVPVGQAVLSLREKIIAGEAPGVQSQEDLFTDALGHPKPPLQALVTYCHYAVIYRKSPVGLPVPHVLANDKTLAGHVEELNSLLQKIAWDAAIRHPLSGCQEVPASK